MSIDIDVNKKLNGFNLDVAFKTQGKCIGILGASGCGKSMTLKCIAGLEKPDKGYIQLNKKLFFNSKQKINIPPQGRRVGYLFQNYALFPHMTVGENIAIGIRQRKVQTDKRVGFIKDIIRNKIYNEMPEVIPPKQRTITIAGLDFQKITNMVSMVIKNIVINKSDMKETDTKKTDTKETDSEEKVIDKLITQFKLDGLKDRYPSELSGGQQQRTALARIFAYEPEVLLLDEPFSALDSFLKDELARELIKVLREFKGEMIMVSHSRDEIYTFCDELIVIDKGEVLIKGETKEIFKNPRHHTVARLTGCKNISKIKRIDKYHLLAIDWGIELETDEEIQSDINYIGIRAHDILWEDISEELDEANIHKQKIRNNSFNMKVNDCIEYPFETEYMIAKAGGCLGTGISNKMLCYKKEKNTKTIAREGVATLPKHKLIMLK